VRPDDGSLDATTPIDTVPAPSGAPSDALTGVPSDAPTGVPAGVPADDRPPASVPPGYRFADVIGRGGMGEVVLAEDLQLGREVAVKRMRSGSPSAEATARFLREARIQARLDHPAVVPVHELGRDPDGRPYFTMKRVTGVTLDRLIADGAPLHKLLRAFVDVCLAVELAHARGVIHRDLKPANVMLGDYGEVYVLDWGVARILAEHEAAAIGGDSQDGETQVGAILGTLGYMSPEQMRGDPVTPATDVYALGATLYEILAGVPAHPRGQAAMASTMSGPPVSPLERRADRAIPPELDAVCMDAMVDDPAARPGARGIADRIQRYLDGDRDVERRRALAAEQLAAARAVLAGGAPAERAGALAAAGRALALDPESKDAAALVTQLILEPPRELPPELVARLAETDRQAIARHTAFAARALSAYFLFIPIALWAGIRSWAVFAGIYGIIGISIIGAIIMSRRRIDSIVWALVANSAVLILLTRLFSPILIVPGLASGVAVALIAFPTLIHRPWLVIGGVLAGFLVPVGLEAAGLWSETWWFEDGRVVIAASAIRLDGLPAAILIVAANTTMVVVLALLVRSLAAMQRAGQRALEIQAWHLGRLLPVDRPAPPAARGDGS